MLIIFNVFGMLRSWLVNQFKLGAGGHKLDTSYDGTLTHCYCCSYQTELMCTVTKTKERTYKVKLCLKTLADSLPFKISNLCKLTPKGNIDGKDDIRQRFSHVSREFYNK